MDLYRGGLLLIHEILMVIGKVNLPIYAKLININVRLERVFLVNVKTSNNFFAQHVEDEDDAVFAANSGKCALGIEFYYLRIAFLEQELVGFCAWQDDFFEAGFG